MNLRIIFAAMVVVVAGCSQQTPQTTPTPTPTPSPSPVPPAVPWSAPHVPRAQVAPAYVQAWNGAENRAKCALVAFAGPDAALTPRTATFGGGWGVAYDTKDVRSAYGIAGAGVDASSATYEWPDRITWSDGSSATYGPEGGPAGLNQLAYLRIAGQGCLYNVWSRLGRDHLLQLLRSIRFVD